MHYFINSKMLPLFILAEYCSDADPCYPSYSLIALPLRFFNLFHITILRITFLYGVFQILKPPSSSEAHKSNSIDLNRGSQELDREGEPCGMFLRWTSGEMKTCILFSASILAFKKQKTVT